MFTWFKPHAPATAAQPAPAATGAGGWLLGLAGATLGVVAGLLSDDDREKPDDQYLARTPRGTEWFDPTIHDPLETYQSTGDPQALEVYQAWSGDKLGGW